jgi:predicted nucleic-acid-binding Zn-ribbon protein
MKANGCCPKCESLELLVVDDVTIVHHEFPDAKAAPMALAFEIKKPNPAMFESAKTLVKSSGFDAWICAQCGYTEWYAKSVHRLRDLAEKSSVVRRVTRSTDDGGPYRA